MPRNTMLDLNNHLFAALERLNDEDLQGEDMEQEIRRAKALTGVASQIIANGQLVVKAAVAQADKLTTDERLPRFLLESGDEK